MNEIKYIEIKDIKLEGELIQKIGFKTKTAIIGGTICGLVFALINFLTKINNIWWYALSVCFVIYAILVKYGIKDYPVMDIYTDGILIYNLDNQNLGFFKKYDEIVEWTPKRSEAGSDAIWFKFDDETEIFKDTFQSGIVYRTFKTNEQLFAKETKQIKMRESRESQLSIIDMTKNLFKKIKNFFKK